MDNISGFTVLSGILSEDTEHNVINVPLQDNFTLVCKNYEVSRENKVVEIPVISKKPSVTLGGVNALTLNASGEVILKEDVSFITTLNKMTERTTPFILNISGQKYENMFLKSYNIEIDKYGTRALCKLIFIQI